MGELQGSPAGPEDSGVISACLTVILDPDMIYTASKAEEQIAPSGKCFPSDSLKGRQADLRHTPFTSLRGLFY